MTTASIPTTDLEIAHQALALIGSTKTITSIDAASTNEDRMVNRFYSQTLYELLEMFSWQWAVDHRPLVLTAGYEAYEDAYGTDPITITGATAANPCVITAATHGFDTGDTVKIWDVAGMTELNRDLPYHITKLTADTFQLTGINSTYLTAYSSGGYCRKQQPKADFQDGYTYELPSDFLLGIKLDSGEKWEIKGGKLLTTDDEPVLEYVKTYTTITGFKSLFVNLFAHRLALRILVPLMGAETGGRMKQVLERDYLRAEAEAMIGNHRGMMAMPASTDSPWINARK